MLFFSLVTALVLLQITGCRAASPTAVPVMGGANFPDPSVIRMQDGWHAFSTNSLNNGKWTHIQVAYTPDWKTWTLRTGKDAMPTLATWIDPVSPRVWAPDVVQLADGSFIMYYTAALASNTKLHCLGYATSTNVGGPYVDASSTPWICPQSQGGAIDPAGYIDAQGRRWITYKIDGNAIGHGGECGNTVPPIVPTPIMLNQVNATDGHSLIGSPEQLITNGALDGPYVEAPSLSKLGDKFVLFFSSQCYATTKYDVSYATSDDIRGPYTKFGPLFVTGTAGMVAPGGLDIAVNGNRGVWHGNYGSGRAMYMGGLSQDNNTITAVIGGP